ncbi:hypothetical protein, partial [Mycobacteroides abscessus]|uniref:hypothetical protein n=1 Tax=Mycobacteroides abscessus TaxID=36809 RepID=UPI0012FFDE38
MSCIGTAPQTAGKMIAFCNCWIRVLLVAVSVWPPDTRNVSMQKDFTDLELLYELEPVVEENVHRHLGVT